MTFSDDLRNDAKGLAKKFSFYPKNPGKNDWSFSNDEVSRKDLSGTYAGFARENVKREYLIAALDLKLGMTDRGESLIVTPTPKGKFGVPAYFLPWDNRGAGVRMTIPEGDPNAPEDTHPKIFFTAVLSGCTVIFKGTPQKPTIYHCGTEGGEVGTPTTGNSNDFFKGMLEGPGYRPVGKQVNSNDYMVNKLGARGLETLEKEFMRNINKQKGVRASGFTVQAVTAWGACFGVRTGRDWKFYLQRNGTISYTKVQKLLVPRDKKTFFGSTTKSTTEATSGLRIAKPIEIMQVFPGTGHAKVSDSWKLVDLALQPVDTTHNPLAGAHMLNVAVTPEEADAIRRG